MAGLKELLYGRLWVGSILWELVGVQECIVWAVAGLRELLCGCWCGRESTLWELAGVQESIMGEVAGLRGLLCGRSWVGKQSVGACGGPRKHSVGGG